MVPRYPRLAVVLGSGLGGLANLVKDPLVIPAGNIPRYPVPTAVGHEGQVIIGTIASKEVVVIRGRSHLYEGLSAEEATMPLRLVKQLGAHSVVITSSAGGMGVPPGTILFITDHLRVGPGPCLGVQGCRQPYDGQWRRRARRAANALGIQSACGTIVWTQGPSYETKAEIRFFMRCGARAVGMSTIPEALEARRLGMRVLGLAVITNAAAGLGPAPLSHEDVLACGAQMTTVMEKLLPAIFQAARG